MTSEPVFASLKALLVQALEVNKRYRDSIPTPVRESFDPESFAAEFCTVRLDVGRRTGKSRLIADLAAAGDVVIVWSHDFKSTFPATAAKVLSIDEALKLALPAGAGPATIWVDEPSFSMCRSEQDRDAIYAGFCGALGERTFVMLGM